MRDVQIYLTRVHADIPADLPVRGGGSVHEVSLEETPHYQVTRGILEAPERYWRHLKG